MSTAIVTGANGFLGQALVQELVQNGYQVWAVSRKGSPSRNGVKAVFCEMSEIESLLQKIPVGAYDLFFHLAWTSVSGPGRADTGLQLQNVQWTLDALRTAKELGCRRFLSVGSIMEYESMAATYTQGGRPGIGYVYGAGKVVAHMMCASVAAQLGIDLVWPMLTNAYGPGEQSPRLVNSTIQKCMRGESPQFTSGTQNYDFVYIEDAVRALRLIGEKGKPFHNYLIGSSSARPLKEFLLEMQTAIAPDLKFCFGDVSFTGIDLPLENFDCSQTEIDTSFRARVSFAEGCKRTMEWWRAQEKTV